VKSKLIAANDKRLYLVCAKYSKRKFSFRHSKYIQLFMTRFFCTIIIALSLFGTLRAPAMAEELGQIVQVVLKKGWRKDNGDHIAALQIILAPGWKTYWRQPGDTGIPPKFDFSGSENLTILDVIYPAPKITWQDNYRSFVYYEIVLFPILIRPEATRTAVLRGKIDIGVCKEICIPVTFEVDTTLTATNLEDTLIKSFLNAKPHVGFGNVVCEFKPVLDGMQISLYLTVAEPEIQHAVIEVGNPKLSIGTPKISQFENQLKIVSNVLTPTGNSVSITRSEVVTTIFSEESVTEFTGCNSS
jgi:DsbC/DsbD-like thiol-disulfide interchange protein